MSKLEFLSEILTTKKPPGVGWGDYIRILNAPIRYQPLYFPGGNTIPKKCSDRIMDSREKLAAIGLPEDLSGKTVLDIGSAEGFFVIQAALRGAAHARGCDLVPSRTDIARTVAKAWRQEARTSFSATPLYDIPPEWAADIVLCFSVLHHLHGKYEHDTWAIISEPEKHARTFANMMQAISAVADLTKEMAFIEYAYKYDGNRPEDIDFTCLGKIWVERGFFDRVEFVGLSDSLQSKDRAIYRAYK
jgi:hypothetical protein